jgi:hypothetical protein
MTVGNVPIVSSSEADYLVAVYVTPYLHPASYL